MNLLQLEYFKTVADLEHMTKSAEKLHVSQPSLSKSIKLLEEELGYDLFNRTGKYIRLNENGKLFYTYVDKSLNSLTDGVLALKNYNEKKSLTVTVSFMAAGKFLPILIKRFNELHPDIKLNLVNIDVESFENSDCDLILYTTLFETSTENSITLSKEDLLLVVNPDHKLAKRKYVNLSEIENEQYISTESESPYKAIIDYYCNIAGISLNKIIEAQYSSTIKGLVESGIGVSIMPEFTWSESYDKDLKFIKIKNPNCFRYIKLMWKKDRYVNDAVKIFKDYIVEFFNTTID